MRPDLRLDALSARAGGPGGFTLGPFSTHFPAGALTAIVGPNGSGKTTLLRAMMETRPLAITGRVDLGGQDLRQVTLRARARTIAFVPQRLELRFPFSALEVVELGRTPHLGFYGVTSGRDRELARQALEATDALHLAARRYDTLSAGEQQRVAIARGLAQDTPVLLLDEPLANLDLAHQELIVRQLHRVAEPGRVVAMVLHDLALAATVCERTLVLDRGAVVAAGPSSDTLTPELVARVFGVAVERLTLSDGRGTLARRLPVPIRAAE